MKVLVPHNKNELFLSEVDTGECFWYEKCLYMRINQVSMLGTKRLDLDYVSAVLLSSGKVFEFHPDTLVILDTEIGILQLQDHDE